MKKNRGFTLVELLACIVIIGILGTVGIMSFGKYLRKSHQDTYLDFEKNMEVGAKNYFVEHSEEIPPLGGSVRLSLEEDLVPNQYSYHLEDPEKKGSLCKGYVDIKRSSVENFNIDMKYQVCLICSSYQSSTCK